ncbi:hypothetical protein H8S75_28890 [Hungatella sp. L12]|uniref:Uncharacterized protein n=1 Tax=Hungatella hominis TaxID=2763050 RepID=A0ABR7HFG7_9FIRM|nr:hypothetical protein [Hungatella hominis]MBC5711948.1 hypothetical protein [Hungatella hominis]
MKKSLILVSCILVFTISACSKGVSQEEYESLASQNNELMSEVQLLSAEKESLADEYESLSNISNELLDEKKERVLNQMDDSYANAWITTSFGSNSTCFSDNVSLLQCSAGNVYPITEEGIAKIYSDLLNSMTTLALVQDNIKYDMISIKFHNVAGTCAMEISLKKQNGSFTLDTIMCNASYTSTIITALNNILSK